MEAGCGSRSSGSCAAGRASGGRAAGVEEAEEEKETRVEEGTAKGKYVRVISSCENYLAGARRRKNE